MKDYSKYKKLSPFEIKDELIKLASTKTNITILNAGRGNPNFLATLPRCAFFQLGLFAESESVLPLSHSSNSIGGIPCIDGIEFRFELFLEKNANKKGIYFLRQAINYIRNELCLSPADFIHEIVEGILGCNYPYPPRILPICEKIVQNYLIKEMGCEHILSKNIDIFATEGGTAAITYLFNSLKKNHIIKKNDKVAIGIPAFTPYIEIPELNDYGLEEVAINANENNSWQYSDSELDKLKDPLIKIFFCTNPSNPSSVKLDNRSLQKIADIIKNYRQDLIILTDDVYSTFVNNFKSLFSVCPNNTILIYSYSKYFGATGWRLGTIAIHKNNIIDKTITKLPQDVKNMLKLSYSSITTNTASLKFIDRLVADSRTVALKHTAGLSTPQQVQMTLFSIFSLMDEHKVYKTTLMQIIHHRKIALYKGLGIKISDNEKSTDYYVLLDIENISKYLYDEPFCIWVKQNLSTNELLFHIANETGIILLPGHGFGAKSLSLRISLANLNELEYTFIGNSLKKIIDEYHMFFLENS